LTGGAVPDTAEMSLAESQIAFTGFFAGIPAKAQAATTGGHAFSVAFEFDGSGIDTGNVISLPAVTIPGSVRRAVIGKPFRWSQV